MNGKLADITVVLDRSGSMQSVAADAIGGFNAFVENLRKEDIDAFLSLVTFNHKYEVDYEGRSLGDVPLLDETTYVPSGMTALLDAVGRAVDSARERLERIPEADRPGRIGFVIITDGHENSSQEYTLPQIRELVRQRREEDGWEFTFLGADIDAIGVAEGIGISAAGAATYSKGKLESMYRVASAKMAGFARDGEPVEYTEEERARLKDD